MQNGCFILICLGFIICLVVGGSFAVGIWVMMAGWGLTVQSWGVIIGGAAIQLVIMIGFNMGVGFIQRLFDDR
jgi:hypothetical protein